MALLVNLARRVVAARVALAVAALVALAGTAEDQHKAVPLAEAGQMPVALVVRLALRSMARRSSPSMEDTRSTFKARRPADVLAVRNRTGHSTAWLEQLVAFADPGLTRDWRIEFLPAAMPHGMCDGHLGLCDGHLLRVLVGMPGDPPAGYHYLARKAIRLRTGAEACVFVLAHELRHCWQHEQALRMRDVPKERDADAYGARVLRRWRRETLREAHNGRKPTRNSCRSARLD
jgi:hypothetical protein